MHDVSPQDTAKSFQGRACSLPIQWSRNSIASTSYGVAATRSTTNHVRMYRRRMAARSITQLHHRQGWTIRSGLKSFARYKTGGR